MKAKEYFKEYYKPILDEEGFLTSKEASDVLTDKTEEVFKKFIQETIFLTNKRKIKKPQALIGVINEQAVKWNSLVNLTNEYAKTDILKRDAYLMILKQTMPEMFEIVAAEKTAKEMPADDSQN